MMVPCTIFSESNKEGLCKSLNIIRSYIIKLRNKHVKPSRQGRQMNDSSQALQALRDTTASPVIYSLAVSSPITPTEPLPPLPVIPRGSLVIVEGRAPIWRYGMALHMLHGSPAAAVAFYDPRLGAVVVASHSREWKVGQVVDVTMPAEGSEDRR